MRQGLEVLNAIESPKITNLYRLSLLILFFFPLILKAQTDERPIRIGIGGGLGSNITRTNIEAYSGSIFCGVFQNGTAPGASFFGRMEIPLPLENFSLMPQIGYHDLSSSFVISPFTIHAYDILTDTVAVYRTQNYTANLKTISLDALLAWRPFSALHLAAGAGLAILIHHTYDQTENLPSNRVYTENLSSTRTVGSGSLEAKTFAASLEFGAGYDFAIRPNVTLSPELRASIPLTPIVLANGSNYRAWNIGGVISLMYALPVSAPVEYIPPPHIELPQAPPPVVETKKEEPVRSILRVSVKAVGKTETGDEVPEPVIAIQNVRVTDVAPTLNYVFFDDGSSDIPKRYHSFSDANQTKSFDPTSLYKLDAYGIHHEVLNILGKRMQDKPVSKITITGTRSLHSTGDSTAASEISLLRAEQTAKYLQDVWNIAPSRIRVKSRALPEQASDDNAATGQAENRRIEITTNTPSLLEPIETHRLERTATPPDISFVSHITSDAGVRSQIITIKQGGKVIKTLDALSASSNGELLWDIAEGNIVEGSDSITWQMDIVDSTGATASVAGNIKIKKEVQNKSRHVSDTTADKSLEKFHLILFDYSSSAELGSISDEIFERIASSITPDSRVSLIGHTDITGDPNYNEHLSYERASRASLLLSSRLHKLGRLAPSFNLEARGAKDILFDNTNAEGRFLSRTVRITIERDLK